MLQNAPRRKPADDIRPVSPATTDFLYDPAATARLIRDVRWDGGIFCPRCRSRGVKKINSFFIHELFQCGECTYTFNCTSGTVFQGSNDNASWTTLTPAAKSTMEWQMLPVASLVPYRYIRIYNPNAWYGNMNEVRLHGSLHGADVTAPATTAAAPQGTVTTDATVTFTATDNQGGSGVAATYYTVDGGAQQTGNSITLTTSGTHTVSYWSKDWAGNTEQAHTVTVSVDKSVDVTASTSISRSGLTVNRFTNKYTGTVTIANTGGQTLAGPLQFRLLGLTAGVTLDSQTGVKDGVPYMALPVTSLAPGQSVTLTTTFSNPNKVGIAYTPALFSIQ